MVLDRSVPCDNPPPTHLKCPADVVRVAQALTEDELVEVFLVALLDKQNAILPNGIITVSRGVLDCSLVHPREVFSPAVCARAGAVMLMHNHPSGTVEPSDDDRAMTKQLVAAGQLLEIEVLDHVIVGPNGEYYSFAERQEL